MSGIQSHILNESIGESREIKEYNALPEITLESLKERLQRDCNESITSLGQFPDPLLFKGMKEALDIFVWAVSNNKRILCVLDSDCDGVGTFITSIEFFKYFGYQNVEFLIVKRHEGYGFIPKHITDRQIKPDVIITADNGITAHPAVELASQMGIYTIITDHHQPNYKGVPKASAVIDPHQPNCMFPYKDINGTVVVWYFFWAVANRLNLNFKDHWYELMAPELTLTTIADVIKLQGLSRFLVKDGLKKFYSSPRNWVRVFMEDRKEVDAEALAFGLIPCINVAARLADATFAANFLVSPTYQTAKEWYNYLKQLNDHRKEKQEVLDKEISTTYPAWLEHPFICVPGQGEIFHKGIIGPSSGRVAEKFCKPTLILTLSSDGSYYSGSGRSVGDIDLLGIVTSSKNIDIDKTGGHKAACGVTIPREKFTNFWYDVQNVAREIPKEMYRPKINAFGKLPIRLIGLPIYNLIKSYEPYGEGFQKPAFATEGIFQEVKLLGKLKNHMKGFVIDEYGCRIPFMWFFFNEPIKSGQKAKFLYTINKDDFASEKSGELELCIHIKNIISNI